MTRGVRLLVLAIGSLLAVATGAVMMDRDEPSSALASAAAPAVEPTTSAVPVTTGAPTSLRATSPSTVRPATTTTKVRTTVTSARPATTALPATTQPPAPAAGNTTADALNLLNRDRTNQGLPALPVRADAQAKAQSWAEKLATDGRLSHSNLTQGLTQCFSGVGENVAVASTVAHAEQILMDDPPHRANILASKWTAVGVGVAPTNSGYMVVQVFVTGC